MSDLCGMIWPMYESIVHDDCVIKGVCTPSRIIEDFQKISVLQTSCFNRLKMFFELEMLIDLYGMKM